MQITKCTIDIHKAHGALHKDKAFYFQPRDCNFLISLDSATNNCHFFENKDPYPAVLALLNKVVLNTKGFSALR